MVLKIPPALARLQSQAGAHRKGLKVLIYGPPKSGKSYFLASFPHPIFAISCGEQGIEPYLDKSLGDVCFNVDTPDQFLLALDTAIANTEGIGSIVIDNVNLLWADWMDWWQEELKVEEIKGHHWRKIKGPWKASQRKLMRFPKHVGMSAWIKDIKYEADGEVKIKRIFEQDNPDTEKTVPYTADLILKSETIKDDKLRPTGFHQIIFVGGRRPRSVPPEELFTGKIWKFNSKKPVESVWRDVIGPLYEKWIDGAVDVLGVDPQEAGDIRAEVEQTGVDESVGRLIREIERAPSTKGEYMKWFEATLKPELLNAGLPKEALDRVKKAHEEKKEKLA